jgi:mannosyl-oligosaccharide glucosidase
MYLPTSLLYFILTLLSSRPTTAEPLPVPASNASLLWGPYRPNLYMGIRPRVPESLFMGLMWGNFDEGHKSKAQRNGVQTQGLECMRTC